MTASAVDRQPLVLAGNLRTHLVRRAVDEVVVDGDLLLDHAFAGPPAGDDYHLARRRPRVAGEEDERLLPEHHLLDGDGDTEAEQVQIMGVAVQQRLLAPAGGPRLLHSVDHLLAGHAKEGVAHASEGVVGRILAFLEASPNRGGAHRNQRLRGERGVEGGQDLAALTGCQLDRLEECGHVGGGAMHRGRLVEAHVGQPVCQRLA